MFTLKNLKIQIENPEKKIIKLNTDFNVVKNNFDNNNNIKFQIRKVSQQNKKKIIIIMFLIKRLKIKVLVYIILLLEIIIIKIIHVYIQEMKLKI